MGAGGLGDILTSAGLSTVLTTEGGAVSPVEDLESMLFPILRLLKEKTNCEICPRAVVVSASCLEYSPASLLM